MIQCLGGAFLGFGLLNWFQRGNRVRGIYGRPIGRANLMFSGVTAVSLARAPAAGADVADVLPLAAILGIVAIAFAWLVFGQGGAASK